MSMVRYPLPITPAMLQPANVNIDRPRYMGAGAAADWHGGDVGHDVDIAEATQAVANSHSANVEIDYDPQHQEGKGKKMAPKLTPLSDLGKDYGIYNTSQYRSGTVEPRTPYPDANSPPAVTGVSPSTGLAAGGTAVTISGTGFTGATGVTFGGTAATAVVVVSPNTITATSPAKAAGTYDVRVTTPKGVSPIGGLADNFIYT